MARDEFDAIGCALILKHFARGGCRVSQGWGVTMMPVLKVPLTLAFGFLFYRLRSRHAFWFGLIEVILAIGLTFLTFVPTQSVLLIEESPLWGSTLSELIGALAAIYVMADGLGNIGSASPPDSSWKWFFSPPR
jgi:hypothetical protein